jgi:hypothetical protein
VPFGATSKRPSKRPKKAVFPKGKLILIADT